MTYKQRQIQCLHFALCSGCTLDSGVETPPLLKEAKCYFEEKGVSEFMHHHGKFEGWRNRAKLVVRGTSQNPIIGLYKEGSHDVVDIPFCRVHHPHINRAVEIIRRFIQQEKIVPYNEMQRSGELRYLQLVVERKTGKVQLTLVLNSESLDQHRWKNLIENIWNENDSWNAIWVNFNTNRVNTIFGKKWELVRGEPFLWEKLGNAEICFQPASFAQANLDLFEKMLKKIGAEISSESIVADFYAGVGVIGLSLVNKAKEVLCFEINPHAEFCFQQAQQKLADEEKHKIKFLVGNASDFTRILNVANVVIVDPPRKGLDKPLLDVLTKNCEKKKLIYVSCGWKAFKRDCDQLLEAGWKLDKAETFLFFPGTDQIETLATFLFD